MYSSSFTPRRRLVGDSFNLTVGEPVCGHIQKTASKLYNSASLICWDFAAIDDWLHMSEDTSFRGGLGLDFDPTSIARLPLLAGDHFEERTANDDPLEYLGNLVYFVLLSAYMVNPTLPRDIFEMRSASAGTVELEGLNFDINQNVIPSASSTAPDTADPSQGIFLTPNFL